ncbi:hypothetical protein ACHAXR_012402 [Thalassiosira sp. AJA248-18]
MVPPAAIVACNIYITAAASHSSTLLSLLRRAQDQCRQLRSQDEDGRRNEFSGNKFIAPISIIHAYADIPYDRSSFHLAGTPDCVSDVASRLICNALNEIDLDCTNNNKSGEGNESRHPFVGLCDHVSVMPLALPINSNDSPHGNSRCEAAAKVAREIGKQISRTNLVNVHYYGKACPNNTPLATVRREMTSFFKSGGAVDKDLPSTEATTVLPDKKLKGDTTIGTPDNFVENFNIRLTSNVSLDQAKTLTQFLRGRNISTKGYGVAGVEALTLPYVRDPCEGGKVYEVACNLTNPKEGSADDIMSQLQKWIEKQKEHLSTEKDSENGTKEFCFGYFVEDAYPVGTTEEQCIEVLLGKKCNDEHDTGALNKAFWEEHDKEIFHKFQELLQ